MILTASCSGSLNTKGHEAWSARRSWRRPSSAAHRSPGKPVFTVARPFHPLFGREFVEEDLLDQGPNWVVKRDLQWKGLQGRDCPPASRCDGYNEVEEAVPFV